MDLTPAGNNLFEKSNIKIIGKKETKQFHTSVTIVIFVAMRARPYVRQTSVVLLTRVKELNQNDWKSWKE